MFSFYIQYLLHKSQRFRSKRERVSISLFKLSMRPVKTVCFETANVRFETQTYVLKRQTYVLKPHAASLNANRNI